MGEHHGIFVLRAEVHLVVTVDDVAMPDPACSIIRARITAMLVSILCEGLRVMDAGALRAKSYLIP